MASDEVCNRLYELRARHRWTQQDMAIKVGVTRQTIIAIEKGQYNPSIVLALKIARALELPVEEVFWLKDEK
ncbi:MAG: helix-turn-helix transcriptional regulator [Chloroflexota bacterium]